MNIQRFVISAVIFLSFTLVQFNFAQGNDVVKLSVKEPSIKVEQGKEFNVDLGLAIDNGWHINSQKPHDDFLIPSEITAKGNGIKLTKVKYPKAHDIKLAFSEAPLSVYEGSVVAGLILRADKNAPVGNQKVNITLDYQACNDMSCMPPTDVSIEFTVEVIENKSEDTAEITTPVETDSNDSEAEFEQLKKNSQQSQSSDENSIASTLEGSGIFLSLIFVFLAGLALNLTPCVYPLIPITIGYFGGQAEGKTSRLVLLGLLYMLGMAITYSVVGVITSLSGAVFGSLLQNPIVIIAIVLLFVALALSQFGVYEFKLPDSLVAKAGGAKGGAYGAFFMGLTMGIVAAPCIGPFVLGLVTYVAAKGDPFYGFLMFFVLALGLGFPYLLLA
ncbi:MAG TPA: cytochrome c biogenesis protein CcdA, partial [Ignavibacteriaceae bacterium]|nr:cytochrome c biogenesis protein CcdA [Ignavibacteriaceae bacterium]